MNKTSLTTIVVGSLALSSCGQENNREAEAGSQLAGPPGETPASNAGSVVDTPQTGEIAGPVHTGAGDITEINGNRITISHGPVESIGWPAMTMTFVAQSPGMIEGFAIGDPVTFEFGRSGETYVLTSINSDVP